MCAAYLLSASIALAVEVAWYLEVNKSADGWKAGAVGLSTLVGVTAPFAWGAMVAILEFWIFCV